MNNNFSLSKSLSTRFFSHVYGWMSFGLMTTAIVSYFAATSPSFVTAIRGGLFWPLVIAQVAIVLYINFRLQAMSYTTAKIAFVAYSILTGLTLSTIFLVYTFSSIATVFFVCSAMFAFMAIYGHYTKSDLTSMGSYLTMLLFGIILSSFANMFFRNSMFELMISVVGAVIFTLLTAYDAQRIKMIAQDFNGSSEELAKFGIFGALTLYLNFINLFLELMRILGKQKE